MDFLELPIPLSLASQSLFGPMTYISDPNDSCEGDNNNIPKKEKDL